MSGNKEDEAIRLVLSMQTKQGTNTDEANVKAAMTKPLIIDNMSNRTTIAQLNEKNELRRRLSRRQHLLPKAERRAMLQPLVSVALEKEMNDIWRAHYGAKAKNVYHLSRVLDLTGCELTIETSTFSKAGLRGTVVGENRDAIHLSNTEASRVYTVRKLGTIFKCDQVKFRRHIWKAPK